MRRVTEPAASENRGPEPPFRLHRQVGDVRGISPPLVVDQPRLGRAVAQDVGPADEHALERSEPPGIEDEHGGVSIDNEPVRRPLDRDPRVIVLRALVGGDTELVGGGRAGLGERLEVEQRPLHAAVAPPSEGPGLQRDSTAIGIMEVELSDRAQEPLGERNSRGHWLRHAADAGALFDDEA